MEAIAMSNVVSINHKRILGTYINTQGRELIPDEAYFVGGVFFSVLFPQFIYCLYGGLLSLIAFASSGLAGALLGLAMYYRLPYRQPSCFDTGTVTQDPPRKDVTLKEAA
jgi:hypothetical protein